MNLKRILLRGKDEKCFIAKISGQEIIPTNRKVKIKKLAPKGLKTSSTIFFKKPEVNYPVNDFKEAIEMFEKKAEEYGADYIVVEEIKKFETNGQSKDKNLGKNYIGLSLKNYQFYKK